MQLRMIWLETDWKMASDPTLSISFQKPDYTLKMWSVAYMSFAEYPIRKAVGSVKF